MFDYLESSYHYKQSANRARLEKHETRTETELSIISKREYSGGVLTPHGIVLVESVWKYEHIKNAAEQKPSSFFAVFWFVYEGFCYRFYTQKFLGERHLKIEAGRFAKQVVQGESVKYSTLRIARETKGES